MSFDLSPFPIRIDGKPYRIEIASWKGRDVTDFSPRATVPGTGAVYADLQLYQPLAYENWTNGFGFIWHTDEAGYLNTGGYIDTRHSRAVMLMTEATSSDTNANIKRGGTTFGSNFYAWGDAGVRRYTSGSWEAVNIQTPISITGADWEASAAGKTDGQTLSIATIDVPTSGQNNAVVLFIAVNDHSNISSITATFGGNAMTEHASSAWGSNEEGLYMFYKTAPATGDDQTATATFNLSAGTVDVVMGAIVLQYVDTSSPFGTPDSSESNAGTAEAASDPPTTGSMQLALSALVLNLAESAASLTASETGQTILVEDDDGTNLMLGVSELRQTDTSAALTIGYTWTGASDYVHMAIPVVPQSEVAVNFLLENGEYLFACPTGGRLLKSANGTDWTPAGLNANSVDYKWLEIHGGYLFAGKASAPEVYFDSASDLSGLAGDPADDTDELIVGPGGDGTLWGGSFLEQLLIGRYDGLWAVNTDDATTTNWFAKRVIAFTNEKDTTNFRSMATHGGNLYFPIQDKKLYQWNGSRLSDQSPTRISDTWEYTMYSRFACFMPYDRWLFYAARDNASTYSEGIIAFDGAGMHKLIDTIIDGDGETTMIAFDTANDYIWYHVSKPTAGTETTYYVPVQAASDLPYANYPTTGTNQITTSRIHGGFRRITKSTSRLWIEVDNVSSTRYIEVYYSLDGDSTYHLWDTVTQDGVNILTLPQGKLSEEFEYINLRFKFVTGTATETPVLEAFALMVLMRPDERWGYTFDVIGSSNTSVGQQVDTRTGYSVMKDLRAARAKKGPIELKTPFGDSVWGYITALTEQAVEEEPEDMRGGRKNILQVIRVNFVEAEDIAGSDVLGH